MKHSVVIPGHNCWRQVPANRAAFLIDGADYFAAFRTAAIKARQSILIVGWDINSRIRLTPTDDHSEWPVQLGDFLTALIHQRPYLQVHILVWDFAMIYALEREPPPLYKLQWPSHRRLTFHMDDRHPVGASHHQKIVVIDDALAFVGGLDLTKCRWDTSEHRAKDPRRVDDDGDTYPPFHDIQLMIDGEAAAALGTLVRTRWHRATAQEPPSVPNSEHSDPWPESIQANMENVPITIARTEPAYQDHAAVREVERLHLDAIAAAQQSIYIENQYLTSTRIGKALANNLRKDRGPEVVLILPRWTSGWLEQATMDVLRARLLKTLRRADRHGRLRIYYPAVAGLAEEGITVHSKLLIVDDALVRIGSANLSNRSMGLDTECDLAVEAGTRSDLRQAIVDLRHRLLSEHLAVTPVQVARTLEQEKSLLRTIDRLQGNERTLRNLDGWVPEPLEQALPDAAIIDPERPLDPEQVTARLLPAMNPDQLNPALPFPWIKTLIIVGLLIMLAGIWRWTPLGQWLDVATLTAWAEGFRDHPLAPLMVIAVFLGASLVVFPVTVLIVVTALIFGPITGFCYALIGTLLAATLTYGIGSRLGRSTVRRLAGSRINRLSRQLANRGLLAMTIVRVVPVAPFTVVNMVAGASHIRFRDFMLGTLFGMGPGTLALTVFADSMMAAIEQPKPANFAWIAVIVLMIVSGLWGYRHWLRKRGRARGLIGNRDL